MNYKVGDKVLINSKLVALKEVHYGNYNVNEDMLHFRGKVCTISEVFDDCYLLKEDPDDWYWTDTMIDGKVNYEPGDKVQIKDDLIAYAQYGHDAFVPQMEPFKGTICTISGFAIRHNGHIRYLIKEDNGKHGWTEEMFEGKVARGQPFSIRLIENDEEPKTAMEAEEQRKKIERLFRNVTYGAFGGQRFGKQKELDTLKQLFKDGENWQEWKTGVRLFYRWHETPIADLKTDRIHNILSIVHDVRQPCSYFGLPRETWIVCLEKELKYREWKDSVNAIYGKKENKEDIEMSNTQLIENKLEKELRALNKARDEEVKNKFYETSIGKAAKAFNEALEQDGNENQKDGYSINIEDLMECSEVNLGKEIYDKYEAKRQEVKEYYAEAITLFESADTYEQKHEILTSYGILKGPKAAKAKVEVK